MEDPATAREAADSVARIRARLQNVVATSRPTSRANPHLRLVVGGLALAAAAAAVWVLYLSGPGFDRAAELQWLRKKRDELRNLADDWTPLLPTGQVAGQAIEVLWRGSPKDPYLVMRPRGAAASDTEYHRSSLQGRAGLLVVWNLGRGAQDPTTVVPVESIPAWPIAGCPPAWRARVAVPAEVLTGRAVPTPMEWYLCSFGESAAPPVAGQPAVRFELGTPSQALPRSLAAARSLHERGLDALVVAAVEQRLLVGEEALVAAGYAMVGLRDRLGLDAVLEELARR
jgi:hypothetical protein